METVKEPEVVDLDFTYGDEYVHVRTNVPGIPHPLCGAESYYSHDGHFWAESSAAIPKVCSCGTPVCPVCRHVAMELDL
jgi:hypothetical protein